MKGRALVTEINNYCVLKRKQKQLAQLKNRCKNQMQIMTKRAQKTFPRGGEIKSTGIRNLNQVLHSLKYEYKLFGRSFPENFDFDIKSAASSISKCWKACYLRKSETHLLSSF